MEAVTLPRHLLISDSATAVFLLLVSIAIVTLAVSGISELCAAPKIYYPQPADTVPALKAPQE